MKRRMISLLLALNLCAACVPPARAGAEDAPQDGASAVTEFTSQQVIPYADGEVPTPQEVYDAMIALKSQAAYAEGTAWTDDTPYNNKNLYRWKGGNFGESYNIVAVGCVAFSFLLSDTAFGNLPARRYPTGQFKLEDVKPGDILRVNGDAHTVIVLQVSSDGVVIAEGNYSGKVHWGRAMSRAEVEAASTYITRYPEGYTPPDDPAANEVIASGTLNAGLSWKLTKSGTLTISGKGAMPDYSSDGEQPWKDHNVLKIVIEDGVTKIGDCAFWNTNALGVTIPGTVTAIGNHAFRGSALVGATIPGSVKTIGDSAFRECKNLSSATLSEGLQTIEGNAFRACNLASVILPASVTTVGAGAFTSCQNLTYASFSACGKLKTLGGDVFAQCWSLMDVELPPNLTVISSGLFLSCKSLYKLYIPKSVTEIEMNAFSSAFVYDIYFNGSESEWKSVYIAVDVKRWFEQIKTQIHYNSSDPGLDHKVHTWGVGVDTKPATCTETGERVSTCTTCGETKTETVPALGHSYSEFAVTTPPTCTEAGEQTSVCAACGDTKREAVLATGHKHGDYVFTVQPTCTTAGELASVCLTCGDTITETVPASGHSHGEYTITAQPTCTTAGERTSVCTACGDTIREEIPATGHSHGEYTVTVQPTCTEAGERTSVCPVCGDTIKEKIPAAGHRHGEYTVTLQPTCSAEGKRTSTCTVCGDEITEAIPKTDHSYGKPAVTTAPTCTAEGVQTELCAVCGDVRTEFIPANGHNFVETDDGDFACANEQKADGSPLLVITKEVKEGYDAVKQAQAPAVPVPPSVSDEEESIRQYSQYVSEQVLEALAKVSVTLQRSITTIRYIAPTETESGWYIYTVTIWRVEQPAASGVTPAAQDSGRVVSTVMTTEPLYLEIPATGKTPAEPSEPDTKPEEPDTKPEEPDTKPDPKPEEPDTKPDPKPEEPTSPSPSPTSRPSSGGGSSKPSIVPVPGGKPPAAETAPDTSPDTAPDTASPSLFADVDPENWFYDSVDYVSTRGLMVGTGDMRFAPDEVVSRAMIWTILARMNKIDVDSGSGGAWYESAMRWTMEQGITDGSDPLGSVTREQLAAMLWRNAGSPECAAELSGFSDVGTVSPYALTAVRWAVENGIINGSGGGLHPQDTATRAQTAAIIARWDSRNAE